MEYVTKLFLNSSEKLDTHLHFSLMLKANYDQLDLSLKQLGSFYGTISNDKPTTVLRLIF